MPTSSSELEAFWTGAAPKSRVRYADVKLIGSGAYSVVARATDQRSGTLVAIKRIAEVRMPPRAGRAPASASAAAPRRTHPSSRAGIL